MQPFSKDHIRLLLQAELSRLAEDSQLHPPGIVRPRLVLGLAINYTKTDLEIFVNSLRGTGYVGDITFLVGILDQETRRYLESMGVHLVSVWQTLFSQMNVQFARHAAYYDYLTDLGRQGIAYERIFVTDVSDVAFQSDPFQALGNADMVCYMEHPSKTIGSCESNSWWVGEGFGADVLAELADKPISCSGTLLTGMMAFRTYLLKMLLTSTHLSDHMVGARGIDQGVHNYLIHKGELGNIRLAENGDGVFTMYWSIAYSEVFVLDGGFIGDTQGRIPAVLHQYNRSDALAGLLRQKWGVS